VAGLCVLVVGLAARGQREPGGTGGAQGHAGEVGTVVEALSPQGKVFVHGELWNATAASGSIAEGARVRVLDVERLRLLVEPAPREGESPCLR
jgi:membrane-bound serine protease (ClpP class)